MFEQSGESFESTGGNCPGKECPFYYQAAGETDAERHAEASRQCRKGCSPPTDKKATDETESSEVERMVNEIADIVFWEDAGDVTEWHLYPFETRQLFGIWREAEKQINRIQQGRMQSFIKSFAGEAK